MNHPARALRILFILMIFTGIFCHLHAQEIIFQKTIGGSGSDQISGVRKTSDNGYIMAGTSDSDVSGDKSHPLLGGTDYWIVKTDATGNIMWQKTIGGTGDDNAEVIVEVPGSGYIVGGSSNSDMSAFKSENCIGQLDLWIVKLDYSGNIEWEETIGGDDYDNLSSLEPTNDGGMIVASWSASGFSPDKSEYSNGPDFWVLKLDSLGNIEWENTIHGNNSDLFPEVTAAANGGYIVCGHSNSDAVEDKTDACRGTWDYWLVKLDASGNIEWDKTYGGGNIEWVRDVEDTPDGGFIICGSTMSVVSGDVTESSHGNMDFWIVRVDSAGNIVWQNSIGGYDSDVPSRILPAPDDCWVICGQSQSGISGEKTSSNKGWFDDFWVVKIDGYGNLLWQEAVGGMYQELLLDAHLTTQGTVVLGGGSPSDISGDKNQACRGYMDFWLVEMSAANNLIRGTAFADLNSNSARDSNEVAVPGLTIFEMSSGTIAFTEWNGSYSMVALDTGSFSVAVVEPNYFNVAPAIHTANFPGMNQTDSLNDFAIQPAGVFNDLCVSITPTGNFRPGLPASYVIHYKNYGTTALSPTIVFYPDTNVSFQLANPAPASVSADSLVWTCSPLLPFQDGVIVVNVLVDFVPIGTMVNSGVHILPLSGDANPACNSSYHEIFITGSFDPNDILVNRGTVYDFELASPPWLEYIIRFQNTGNDTAFSVVVMNNIPDELDISTFEWVAASHPINITFGNNARLMEFSYPGILLPDSNANEPGSHGFIRYRIRPVSSLAPGDSIKNRALIYFDHNVPVITNDAITEIIHPTGMSPGNLIKEEAPYLFPNPAKEEFTIERIMLAGEPINVSLYDLSGRQRNELFQGVPGEKHTGLTFDVNHLPAGMYFVKIESGKACYYLKLMKL